MTASAGTVSSDVAGAENSDAGDTATSGAGGTTSSGAGGTKPVAGGAMNGAGGRRNSGAGGASSGGAKNGGAGGTTGGGSTGGSATNGGTTNGGATQGGSGGVDLISEYRRAIIADRPLAYWRMGTVINRVVPDATGNGNGLALQGTGHEFGVEGAIVSDSDGAIGFDGAASYATATNARAFDFADNAPFTLECWAKRRNGGASYFQHLFSSLQGSAGARNGYALYILPEPATGETARSVFEYDLPAADLGSWGPLPAEATWAHYAATYDGMMAKIYVNGELADSSLVRAGIAARTIPFSVARDSSASFFKGSLDELAIYPRALSAADLARHFGFHK